MWIESRCAESYTRLCRGAVSMGTVVEANWLCSRCTTTAGSLHGTTRWLARSESQSTGQRGLSQLLLKEWHDVVEDCVSLQSDRNSKRDVGVCIILHNRLNHAAFWLRFRWIGNCMHLGPASSCCCRQSQRLKVLAAAHSGSLLTLSYHRRQYRLW